MEDDTPKDIRKFLEQSLRFYEHIDIYSASLEIDAGELETFKNDVRIFLFISERYKGFTTSFVLYNIDVMRRRFGHLVRTCLASKNYTSEVGRILGIIHPPQRIPWPLIPSVGNVLKATFHWA